jgi:hypothetical protein
MASSRSKANIACYPGFVATLRVRGRAKRPATRRAGTVASAPQPAEVERSLYLNVVGIKERHELERLAVACYDAETRVQWSYDADASRDILETLARLTR